MRRLELHHGGKSQQQLWRVAVQREPDVPPVFPGRRGRRCSRCAQGGNHSSHHVTATAEDVDRLVRRRRPAWVTPPATASVVDRKSTRLNSSHLGISYAVFCL